MPRFVDELRAYVGFGAADEAALRRLAPHLERVRRGLVDDFYQEILEHEEARRALADGAQLERLKLSLAEWLTRLLSGPFDDEWLERSARIGRRHVEVGLPPRFMPLAMDRLRRALVQLALESPWKEPADAPAVVAAVEKACDLELTAMLESYAEMHQARVRESERLSAVGQLAATVGEELKNPLGVIQTSVLLVEKRLGAGAGDVELAAFVRSHLDRISRSAKQATRISSQLLEYARAKRPRLRTIPLAPLLQEAVLAADEHAGIEIDWSCAPPDATALVDPSDVGRVLSHLLRNAIQAIRESGRGGRITLAARRDGVGVAFTVSDDGPGIPTEISARIFEPLFTTRTRGAGLGLSIARDLIEAHGGRLTVASTPGRGAQFTVHLPQEAASR
jgi:signal transduction histidine kinase